MATESARRPAGSRRAIVYAVLVHAVLALLVVAGIRWQSKPETPAPVVQAQVVNEAEVKKEVERRQREARQRDQQEARAKREQDERARKSVEDKRRAEQATLAEQKRKDDQKRKAEAEKKRKDDERRQTDARKKKDTEERRLAAEQNLKEQLTREEQERADARARAEQAARAHGEMARVEGLIRQKVERNWVRPAGWNKGLECIVRVRLIPTGEVIQATVTRSSGNPAFDRSVENAVYKASPLPLPEDKGLFEHFRELEMRFHPEGQA
jgi:colicin import membrane protein